MTETTQLANEIFETIYTDFSDEIDRQTKKLCSELGRTNNREYNDFEDSKNLIISALFDRLSRAKESTLKRYYNDKDAQKKLIAQVKKQVKDDEVNGGKIYTIEREFVEQYDWKSDETTTAYKQVRVYQQQVSFDKEFKTDSDTKFTLKGNITSSDIVTPEVTVLEKADVIQVMKNLDLFTVPTRPFVSMLLKLGGEQTEIELEMKHGELNKKTKRVIEYINKHKNIFNAIPSGKQYSLLDMAHFQNMLNAFEPSQVQKWLIENRYTPWVSYILDEVVDSSYRVLVNWDKEGYRYYTYQFINAMYELEEQYQKEVAR